MALHITSGNDFFTASESVMTHTFAICEKEGKANRHCKAIEEANGPYELHVSLIFAHRTATPSSNHSDTIL